MQITVYPKRLLISALSFAVLWLLLSAALDTRAAAGVAAVVCMAASITLEVFLAINPAAWGRMTRSTPFRRASR